MRHWFVFNIVLLITALSAFSADVILDPGALPLKSKVTDLENSFGKWQEVKYGWIVTEAEKDGRKCQAVYSEWKSFVSTFNFSAPLLDGDEVQFSYCKTSDRTPGEIFIFLDSKGKHQAGLKISNDRSVACFDADAHNRDKLTGIPADTFTTQIDRWHQVRMVFHPNGAMGGSYDLYVDDVKIKEGIKYANSAKTLTDSLSLRGCNYDKGGREILLGAFSVKRGGQTIEDFKKYASLSLDVAPASSEVGTLFADNKPVKFDVKIKNYSPELDVKWSIYPLYSEDSYLFKDQKVNVSDDGTAEITIPANTPRQVYMLETSVYLGKQVIAIEELRFAVMAPCDEGKVDIEKEWLGVDTVELSADSKTFEQQVQVIKLIGLHWVRKKHTWARQHKSLEDGPQLDGLVKIADRMEKENIKCIEDIQGTPDWASSAPEKGSSRWKYPPAKWEYWQVYIQALVKALGDRTQYQLWCEPASWMAIDRIEKQYPDGIPQVLGQYWKTAKEAINNIAPKARLLGPAVSSGNMALLDLMIRSGDYKKLDAITYHYPKWPNTPRSSNQRVLREMIRYGGKALPQIIDESSAINYSSAESKAKYAARLQTYLRYWAEGLADRYFVYVLHAPDRHADLVSSKDFQPQGGIVAFQSLVHRTRGTQYIGKINLRKDVESYLYKKNGKLSVVLWNNGSEGVKLKEVLAKVLKSNSRCYDTYSNLIGDMETLLTGMPVYVEDIDAGFLGDVMVQLQPVELRLDSDIELPVTLTIANLKAGPVEASIELNDRNAGIVPNTLQLKLESYQVVSKSVTIKPKAPARTGFKAEFVKAQVNGKEQLIGFAQYYNKDAIKSVEAGQFGSSENLWKIDEHSGVFDHGSSIANQKKDEGDKIGYTPVKKADGTTCGLFTADLAPSKKAWFGINYARGIPFEIPGIPVNMRMKMHVTTDMLSSNAGLLLLFEDAKGKLMNYQITPFISPTDKHETFVMESLIDSPMGNAYRHSQFGGTDNNHMYYPLKFTGFSINPTPQRDKTIRWVSSIEIESIEFDCYDSPVPVERVTQVYDPTPQF